MHWGRIFINQPKRTEVVNLSDRLDISTAREVPANQESLSIILGVGMVILLMILLHWNSNFLKTISRSLGYLKEGNHGHCRRCKFYHPNAYLKCAVHPSKVLSTAAQDCPDYSSSGSCSK